MYKSLLFLFRNCIKYLESEVEREEQRLSTAAGLLLLFILKSSRRWPRKNLFKVGPSMGMGIINGLSVDSLIQTQAIPLPYDPLLTAKLTKPFKVEPSKQPPEIPKPTPPPRHSLTA